MKKIAFFFTLITVFAACKKTDNPPLLPVPNVYIVGHDNLTAKYWKNDTLTKLTDGTVFSEATDITLSGKDVYILGHEGSFLKYWKNGIATNLTDGSFSVYPTGIAVKGNDVYAVGEITPGFTVVAAFWKNGVLTWLTSGVNGLGYANGIAIGGNGDVYVVGSEGLTAKYWKNGVAVSLTNGSTPASANAISIVGNDVYIAGIENNVVKYWKNGLATSVSGVADPDKTYNVSSIFINGADVYLGGQIVSQNITDVNKVYRVAAYWKNNTVTELTGRKAPAGLVRSMAVYGTDVYAAGEQFDQVNSRDVSRYWKNGTAVSLTDSSKAVAGLYKIIVQ